MADKINFTVATSSDYFQDLEIWLLHSALNWRTLIWNFDWRGAENLHVPVPDADADLASLALGAFLLSTWRFLLSPYLTFPPDLVVFSVLPQQLASWPILFIRFKYYYIEHLFYLNQITLFQSVLCLTPRTFLLKILSFHAQKWSHYRPCPFRRALILYTLRDWSLDQRFHYAIDSLSTSSQEHFPSQGYRSLQVCSFCISWSRAQLILRSVLVLFRMLPISFTQLYSRSCRTWESVDCRRIQFVRALFRVVLWCLWGKWQFWCVTWILVC